MTKTPEIEKCFGQHGWKEFNRTRKDILTELDRIIELTQNRPVQVAHGQSVEAHLRKWLSEFLPKKYGVTSGYIIPNIYDDSLELYHFDIIIYNRLESPILWTEGNFDQSEQGKYRAVPAKHVVAVYEVKSRLTKSNVTDALKKLNQTKDFSDQLNKLYSCGIIFIDLKEKENNDESIIKELIKGSDIHGFSGGMILRYEGDDSCIGNIKLFDLKPEDKISTGLYKPIAKPIDSLNIFINEDGSMQMAEQGCGAKLVATSKNNWSVSKSYGTTFQEGQKSIHIDWSRSNFSDFCIDLISTLEGLVFNDRNRPSFGQVFDHIERKKCPLQSDNPVKGKPFLKMKLYDGSELGDKLKMTTDSVTFMVTIENTGETTAILSDDSFKTHCDLPAGKTATKPVTLQMQTSDSKKTLSDALKKEAVEFIYRVVYCTDREKRDFLSIEKKVKIFKDEVTLSDTAS